MNGNDELTLRYTDFLEEAKRLNHSILNDERKEAIKERNEEIVLNMHKKGWNSEMISEGT